MADDLKYGYKGAEPTQSFGSNTGVFNSAEINDLVANNKWTSFGQLELIETQTFSTSVAQIDFTDIQEDIYNVHLLTAQVKFGSGNNDLLGMRFFESGVLETGSVYQIATQNGQSNGTFSEARQTAYSWIFLGETTDAFQNVYCYLYNLGDNTKYSFSTFQGIHLDSPQDAFFRFGSAVLPQASTVDGIRLFGGISGNNIGADFDVSLYGIRYS